MEIKYLDTFYTIVKEGGFREAAEKLNYTQSTITFQMGQLEKELAVPLFEKVGRRMVLTAAGKALIPYAENVINAMHQISNFRDDLTEYDGELRIGVAETFLCYKLAPVLKEMVKKAPRAKLMIQSLNCYDIRDRLLTGELDVGIFYREIGGNMENLIFKPIESYPVVMVTSSNHADMLKDFAASQRNYPLPFVINEEKCIFRQIFEQYLKEQGIALSHTIQLESIETIKHLVMNDVGITFLPRFAVEQELKSGQLTAIETGVKRDSLTITLGYHKNKWKSPLMEVFEEQIIHME